MDNELQNLVPNLLEAILEVYGLVEGEYQLRSGNPIWLPEIGLALGRDRGTYLGRTREWLYGYDRQGDRLPTPEELAQQEHQRAELADRRAERLAAKLRELGIDPSQFNGD